METNRFSPPVSTLVSTNHRTVEHLCLILVVPSVLLLAACESPRNGNGHQTEKATSQAKAKTADSTDTDVEWRQTVQVADGPAVAGPWRMNDSKFHYVDDPTVALDDEGRPHVVWVDNQRQQIFFQQFDREGNPSLDEPTMVTDSPEIFSWLPQMAIGDGDPPNVYVFWQEIVFSGGSHGGEAFFARSTDGGETFEAPVNLSRSKAGDGKGRLTEEIWDNGSLDIERADDGTLYVAWTEYEGRLWFARSTDRGANFSEPYQVADDAHRPARGPDLAVGPDGDVLLTWTVGSDTSADIRLTRSTDRGQSFGSPRTPVEASAHDDGPKVAVDRERTVHLAWGRGPDGRGNPYRVAYARLRGGDLVGDPRTLAAPGDDVASTDFPALRVAGDNVVMVWERHPVVGRQPVGLGFVRSSDGGDSFLSGGLVPGARRTDLGVNGSLQGQLMQKLDVNDSGDIAVVNSRFRPEEKSRVRLHLGRSD